MAAFRLRGLKAEQGEDEFETYYLNKTHIERQNYFGQNNFNHPNPDEPEPHRKMFIRRTSPKSPSVTAFLGESRCLRRFSADKFLLFLQRVHL
jgi:hypothetical protein